MNNLLIIYIKLIKNQMWLCSKLDLQFLITLHPSWRRWSNTTHRGTFFLKIQEKWILSNCCYEMYEQLHTLLLDYTQYKRYLWFVQQ